MSEYKRANAFGNGYLDTDDLFKVKIENKTKKRHAEIAGDDNALKAFGEIPENPIAYKYDSESKTMKGLDGKDYYTVEITDPEGRRMIKTCDYKSYMKIIQTYNVVLEGKWKEWKKDSNGGIKAVRISE